VPVWCVTGNMGSGKTVYAVTKAFEYLDKGLPVATNIDLSPENYFSPMKTEQTTILYRLPDSPTVEDFDRLGYGNTSNDESRNGLIVLDEAGTLLNSRQFMDSTRKGMIGWFVHARKLGWDLMFVIQSLAALDKQVREMLIEYRVQCRRVDRLKMPLIGWLGLRLPLPRIHMAQCRYGLHPNAPVADFQFYRGNDVFRAYNTKQILRRPTSEGAIVDDSIAVDRKRMDLEPGLFSFLSPWHLKGMHMDRKQIYREAGRRSFLAGLIVGTCLVWGGYSAWIHRSISTAADSAAITWSAGSYVITDGVATIIDEKGKRYASRDWKLDGLGVAVLVDGKWHGIRRNG
jgi:hypothetical protein